jgi:hypothetical protein
MDRLRRHPICVMTCLGLAAILWGVVAAALTSPARANKRFDHRGRHDVALVTPITPVSSHARRSRVSCSPNVTPQGRTNTSKKPSLTS